jgi:hypothetical protein
MSEEKLIDQIRQRAFEIWLDEGCPDGRDRIHWLHAEAEFREKLQRGSHAKGNGPPRRSPGPNGRRRQPREQEKRDAVTAR